jgi:anaerobic selenocysteine-containing dehydrogenase
VTFGSSPEKTFVMNTIRTVYQGCHSECGVLVEVEGQKVLRIKGDPNHPASRGHICIKGATYGDALRHPDRLQHPLKRIGEKGSGRWQRISWDQALDEIGDKLTEIRMMHGPCSIGTFHGTAPRQALFFARLLGKAFGTPNVLNTDLHICYAPSMVAEFATVGASVLQEQGPDYLNARCILVFGGNPPISHPGRGRDLLEAVNKKQAKLIVVDPRNTELAKCADLWLQVRPGSDQALILAFLHIIISEQLYDREFVERYCHGFSELAVHVRTYSPEWAADLTWLTTAKIRAAARMYATTKPAAVHRRVALDQNLNSTQSARAVLALMAITGNLDVPGGNLIPTPVPGFISTGALMGYSKPAKEIACQRLGAAEYPLISGPDGLFLFVHPAIPKRAMLEGNPYPLKALLLGGGNPIVNEQDSCHAWAAFKSLDLLVVCDFFMTPTAELADYVLPATTWLERDDCCDEPYLNCSAARQKAVDAPPECLDDIQIAIDLLRRIPWADPSIIPWKISAEFNDYRVRGMGMTFEQFKSEGHISPAPITRKYEQCNLRTPTGKVELWSTIFEKHRYRPLPDYVEPPHSLVSTPELMGNYPYILVTGGRTIEYYLSAGRQIAKIRRCMPDPLLEIHPDAAAKESLQDGDWVWVETPLVKNRRVKLRIKTTSDFDSRVVHAQHGWWFPERPAPEHGCFESNINLVLTDSPPREPICGSVPLRERFVGFTR